MKQGEEGKEFLLLAIIGLPAVIWVALLTAPYLSGGLLEIVKQLPKAMNHPFEITICESSLKTVLIFVCAPWARSNG